nr:6K1 [Platycodon mild mottle virus]
AKSQEQAQLERIIAVIALILMVFDAERSDCVYKILNKLRTLVGISSSDTMKFQ